MNKIQFSSENVTNNFFNCFTYVILNCSLLLLLILDPSDTLERISRPKGRPEGSFGGIDRDHGFRPAADEPRDDWSEPGS